MRRPAKIAVVAASLVLGGTLLWTIFGRGGYSDVERWIGRQLVQTLQNYVTPTIGYDELRYQPPLGVTVTGLRFTLEDRRILLIDRALLELAEIPRSGGPVRIRRAQFERPRLRFITNQDGDLLGWENFLRPDAMSRDKTAPEGTRFSDILALRHVSIRDGQVAYEPGDGGEPMVVPGITLDLDTPPSEAPGWYDLKGRFHREPVVDAQFDARINLDTAQLDVHRLVLDAALGEQQYHTLPPPVQHLLRRYEVQGTLHATMAGSLPLQQIKRSTVSWDAELRDAHIAYDGSRLPLDRLHVAGKIPGGPIDVELAGFKLGHQGHPLLSVGALSVSIPELPQGENPLIIDSARVEGFRLRLMQDQDGSYLGWSALGESAPTGSGFGLRSFLQHVSIREFLASDAGVTIHLPQLGGPLELDGIELALRSKRTQAGVEIDTTVSREPVISGRIAGTIPPAVDALELREAVIEADLRAETTEALPESARQALARQPLRGQLTLTAEGRIDVKAPATSQITFQAKGTAVSLVRDAMDARAEQLSASISLPGRLVQASGTRLSLSRDDLKFFTADRVSVELDAPGPQAVEIRNLAMTHPVFTLVPRDGDGFRGWSDLSDGADDGPSVMLHALDMQQAEVVYQPSAAAPTIVEGIDASVALSQSETPGAFAFTGKVSREPVLRATATGRYLRDDVILELSDARISGDLSEEHYAAMPERMQQTLRRYELEGQLDVQFAGRIPLSDPLEAEGDARVDLKRGRFAYAGTTWPIDHLQLAARLPHGRLDVSAHEVRSRVGNRTFLAIRDIRLSLPEIPTMDRPIDIDRIELDTPAVLLLDDGQDGLLGWSRLADAGDDEAGSAQRRPSPAEAVILRDLRIRNGELIYDAGDGSEPMSLPGINIDLQMPPVSGRRGVHAIRGTIRREPVLDVRFDGQASIDDAILDLTECRILTTLSEQQYETLPPRLQELLRRHEVRGQLDASVTGRIPLLDPLQMEAQFAADLQNVRLAFDETVWPVQRCNLKGTVSGETVATHYDMSLLAGTARGTGTWRLTADSPFQLTWQVENVRMEDTLRVVQQGEPKYSGRISSQGRITGRGERLPESLSGLASLQVSDGRLMRLPVVRDLLAAVLGSRLQGEPRDSAKATIHIRSDHVNVTEMDVTSSLVGLRGNGQVFYDGRIRFDINADVVSRLENVVDPGRLLGRLNPLRNITGMIGEVADQVVTYEVQGTLSAPRVRVKPLGLGR